MTGNHSLFFDWANTIFPDVQVSSDSISFGEKLKVHFLSIVHNAKFDRNLSRNEIVLWEDIWHNRQEQVKARIISMLGKNQTISARNTVIKRIDKLDMDSFLDANHLMDVVSAKHKYGLMYKGILVAMASFSSPKTFYREEGEFRSVELVRYASLKGVNVTGGLGKLLEHFIEEHEPDDIMTYTDREWSTGEVYEKLGFKKVEQTSPLVFWVHPEQMIRYQPHRLPKELLSEQVNCGIELEEFLVLKGYCKIYNQGNNKFLLKLK